MSRSPILGTIRTIERDLKERGQVHIYALVNILTEIDRVFPDTLKCIAHPYLGIGSQPREFADIPYFEFLYTYPYTTSEVYDHRYEAVSLPLKRTEYEHARRFRNYVVNRLNIVINSVNFGNYTVTEHRIAPKVWALKAYVPEVVRKAVHAHAERTQHTLFGFSMWSAYPEGIVDIHAWGIRTNVKGMIWVNDARGYIDCIGRCVARGCP